MDGHRVTIIKNELSSIFNGASGFSGPAALEKVYLAVRRSDKMLFERVEEIVLLIVEVMEKIVVRCLGNT